MEDFEEYHRKKNEAFLKCYEHITDPVERVKELFKHTENEAFMGGELMECKMLTDDLIGIASKRRMDANMMCSLMTLLGGRIVFGSMHNDCLILKINADKDQERILVKRIEFKEGWVDSNKPMKSLFNQLKEENLDKVIFDFKNIKIINQKFADEYVNQKWKASFEVIEKNMSEDIRNFLNMRKEYYEVLGNSLKPNFNIDMEKVKDDYLRRLMMLEEKDGGFANDSYNGIKRQ